MQEKYQCDESSQVGGPPDYTQYPAKDAHPGFCQRRQRLEYWWQIGNCLSHNWFGQSASCHLDANFQCLVSTLFSGDAHRNSSAPQRTPIRHLSTRPAHGILIPNERVYSSQPYKSSPNLLVEDLGIKDIHGVSAHGVRHTTLGTEVDGDWSGKSLRESEEWVSDDLAAMMLVIEKDFRTGRDTRRELENIQRGDPDPALFTIPPDYKIDPKIPEDLPREFHDPSGPLHPRR